MAKQPARTARLIWTFYKTFLPASLAITIICIHLFRQYGFSIFHALFWLKLITLGLIYYYMNGARKREYYYYYNLGLSRRLLWSITLVFDFLFFLTSIILTSKYL